MLRADRIFNSESLRCRSLVRIDVRTWFFAYSIQFSKSVCFRFRRAVVVQRVLFFKKFFKNLLYLSPSLSLRQPFLWRAVVDQRAFVFKKFFSVIFFT